MVLMIQKCVHMDEGARRSNKSGQPSDKGEWRSQNVSKMCGYPLWMTSKKAKIFHVWKI